MINIKVTQGPWKDNSIYTTLIHEKCNNPVCERSKSDGFMYYPNWLRSPICNKCETELIGARLVDNKTDRIEFHLKGDL